jgi:hypothetical protein
MKSRTDFSTFKKIKSIGVPEEWIKTCFQLKRSKQKREIYGCITDEPKNCRPAFKRPVMYTQAIFTITEFFPHNNMLVQTHRYCSRPWAVYLLGADQLATEKGSNIGLDEIIKCGTSQSLFGIKHPRPIIWEIKSRKMR